MLRQDTHRNSEQPASITAENEGKLMPNIFSEWRV